MMILAAALVFAVMVTTVLGVWWIWTEQRRVQQRLRTREGHVDDPALLVTPVRPPSRAEQLFAKSDLIGWLVRLSEEAGRRQSATDLTLLLMVWAVVGGALGWWRTGHITGFLLAALVGGSLPILYLLYKRGRRRRQFEEQFPDTVDMIARSLRAGNALTAAIQMVADEMPAPTGEEFRKLADEVRLGLNPAEALGRLRERMPTDDAAFFCIAVNIQRTSGGNLAEILDRLSDVIRKRFELLSHAKVLSAQQRYSAICVGASPFAFAVLFNFLQPGYFDPLLESPIAPMLIGGGLVMQTVGFLIIWRIAQIKV